MEISTKKYEPEWAPAPLTIYREADGLVLETMATDRDSRTPVKLRFSMEAAKVLKESLEELSDKRKTRHMKRPVRTVA